MNTDFNRVVQKLCGAAICAALLTSTSLAREKPDPLGSARQVKTDVAGLNAPAQILVDVWGIPHIYAGNERDLFFLQGFNAARDRLWQIDLWRKRGLGLLAKDFGPAYAEQDKALRLFLYRGDMNAEWAAYGPKGKTYAEAFVAGVNAYVADVRAGKRPLPIEFRIAGTMPDPWTADDIVRIRSHGLTRNVASEVKRSLVACAAGLDADRFRVKLEPAWTTKIPDGLDPCSVPKAVLAPYDLATRPVAFAAPKDRQAALAHDPDKYLTEADQQRDTIGSNNWVIAASRTATGRPILANDPHREHSVPSLRYIVGLNAPGLSVIGAGEPALPGISIGHNGTIAFGLTIFNVDQEDLYVYERNPENPNQYRYGNGWEDMRIVHEKEQVKGESDRDLELKFTRHGPVIYVDDANKRAFAVRSIWFEPGTSAYFGSSDYMTAKDWNGFLGAMRRWGAPSENQVYADTKGNIGWVAAGKTPRRANYDGLMPVPGDGRYEWQGFLSLDELPKAYQPKQGFLATANQMNLPADYPVSERKVGFEWADSARWQRITEVLNANSKVTLADAMDLQNDDTTMLGRRLVKLLQPLTSDDANVKKGLELLKPWDARDAADSAAAPVFEVWIANHLGPVLLKTTAPKAADLIAPEASSISALVAFLESPDASFGSDPAAARDQILRDSLGAAVADVTAKLGADSSTWRWGRLHVAKFDHALMPLADKATAAQLSVGPLAYGGAANVPRAATYRRTDYQLFAGASFRMVLDVGNWDASRTINTPGQSGDPFSGHYRDLAPLWATGQYVPLLYSRAAVEAATAEAITLTPR
ncbi:penicillin acylase family protein [Bradyrhizobium canariense]|uniref:penicillin acylase family protein n=1 Tax=Bradyrhizobium canariense TaxID=255045 RepID=UPI000A1980EC|nr:penicillin acylase family protein [Bradyrhizobium canariense]OSI22143.1 penicillin acylase family protein [Bradyrhizobium canariense]OSI26734.1 penicillin acylase family protein [Bradyrhizobium canariense]OSI39514.1 penicillin acylase family protein [Bradyrhizobium canariense]OSI45945.1 penicillin acylase family protein [Bradyrhizobium canariense]OSI52736.1 penicillin acylase family protein [Bradyrhizobium canariense]